MKADDRITFGMRPSMKMSFHSAPEDGYNMAAGLPVLGNCHPTSPIRNGVNGFLSDDPAELRIFAWQLLRDSDLVMRLGAEARKTVTELFSTEKF